MCGVQNVQKIKLEPIFMLLSDKTEFWSLLIRTFGSGLRIPIRMDPPCRISIKVKK